MGLAKKSEFQIDDLVKYVTLHIPNPLPLNGTIFPFVFLYAIVVYVWLFIYGFEEYYELGIIGMVGSAFLQILTSLCCYWSVHINTFLNFRKVSTQFENEVRFSLEYVLLSHFVYLRH